MSTNTYKNVLLVGASGDVGKNILSHLLEDSNFTISVLSRIDSTSSFPPNIIVIKLDYSNLAALVEALTGQDIVISAVGGEAIINNFDRILIEAALEAGVKWFIPSEYGFDLDNESAATIPVHIPLIENITLLRQHQSNLAHTFISTGAFLDWGLDNGFLCFDIPNHTATLYDEGKHPVSGTLLKNLGKAIVAILHHPELTLNKRIYIVDTTFTQKQVLTLLEKYTGTKWIVNHVTTEETLKKGEEDWINGNLMDAYITFILGLAYNGNGACDFENKSSNAALGLEKISLEQIIKEAVERNQTITQ